MTKTRRRVVWAHPGVCAIALLVVLAVVSAASRPAAGIAPERIFAVGDIHGDFDSLVAILRQAGLIDSQPRWTGGKATLVQTGDFLDRGPKVREVTDLLMALEKQARKAGGRVVVLLGNHEAMNLFGDLRYVTAENYASFADENSEKRRKAAYQAYVQLLTSRAQARKEPLPAFTPEREREWRATHPLGFVEHQEAFSPEGKYGRWLRERPAIVQVGDIIFLHGGISPQLPATNLKQIDERIKHEIRAFDSYRKYLVEHNLILPFFTLAEMTGAARAEVDARKAEAAEARLGRAREAKTAEASDKEQQQLKVLEDFLRYPAWFSIHPDGPLWFRGFAESPEEEEASRVANLLRTYGAAHFVVGHTPQGDGRIQARFGGKVFLIDTGMLASYYLGGRASALEIQNGKFTAIYLDQRKVLLERPSAASPSTVDLRVAGQQAGGVAVKLDLPNRIQ